MTTEQICSDIKHMIARYDAMLAHLDWLEQERKNIVTTAPIEVNCPF